MATLLFGDYETDITFSPSQNIRVLGLREACEFFFCTVFRPFNGIGLAGKPDLERKYHQNDIFEPWSRSFKHRWWLNQKLDDAFKHFYFIMSVLKPCWWWLEPNEFERYMIYVMLTFWIISRSTSRAWNSPRKIDGSNFALFPMFPVGLPKIGPWFWSEFSL